MKPAISSLAAAAILAMQPAYGGRPMIVDDAAIVAARSCQLETWVQDNVSGNEYWALPACNLGGNLELAVGAARVTGAATRRTVAVLQGKTLFKPLETNGWGIGLVFGNQFDVRGSAGGDLYARVPVSYSLRDDQVLLHMNLGWLREAQGHRHALTWGVGSEIQLTRRSGLTLDIVGRHRGNPSYQVGFRHWLLADRLQIDASYGNRFGSGERGVSIGLVLFTGPILP